jgi:hypothetical protein
LDIVDYHSLFLSSSSKIHRAVPLLQTCCTYNQHLFITPTMWGHFKST